MAKRETAKGAERFVACFDLHGNKQHAPTVGVFHEFCKFWKPKIRIHGGDGFNFVALRKGATEEERRERLNEDIDAGVQFIREFKPTHYLRGNHCERMWDAANGDDGKLADLAAYIITDIKDALKDAVVYPYDKRKGILRIGHLKVVHGYNAGVTAARLAAQVYGSVLMGHIHSIDTYSIPGLERRIGRACGCMCELDMDYNRAQVQTLRQAHGFAYGIILPDGEYLVWQAEEVSGRWYFPTEMREFATANGTKA